MQCSTLLRSRPFHLPPARQQIARRPRDRETRVISSAVLAEVLIDQTTEGAMARIARVAGRTDAGRPGVGAEGELGLSKEEGPGD